LRERATVIRAIFQALPIITAMKHAIAHWLNDEQWRTVRPTLKRSERVVAPLVEQLTAVGVTMPGASQ
jgi:4-hydroxy-tetrahydrodipicolinate synthase